MIHSDYKLVCVCDRLGCGMSREFHAMNFSRASIIARAAGWAIKHGKRRAYCPSHHPKRPSSQLNHGVTA